MPQEKPILDDWAVERLPFCIPVAKPMPIPTAAWNDAPTRCITINAEWCSHLLGALECLDQPDAWQGTESEIFDARQQVREIMLAVSGAYECEEPMPTEYLKSVVGCDNRTLEFIRVVDGVEGSIFVPLCDVIPSQYVYSVGGCSDGSLQINTIIGEETDVAYLNLAVCLEGQFLTSGDLPPVPVPSLVGDDLWFDTDGDTIADLNVGNVRGLTGDTGLTGSDGSDGSNGLTPTPAIVGVNLWFDTDGDTLVDLNLGRVVGEDGDCPGCDQVPPPDQTNDPDNNDLMCSIAINEAAYLRSLWDKAYNDSDGFVSQYLGAFITGATLLAFFFPGVGIVGVIAGFLIGAFTSISQLEANIFDNDLEEWARCTLFCVLKRLNKTVIDQAVIDAWGVDFAVGMDAYQLYARDLIIYTPIAEFQWIAYASSAVDEAACAACDCDDEETWCYEWDFTINNRGWTNWQPAGRGAAGYVAATGWHGVSTSGGMDAISIRRNWTTAITFTSIEVHFQSPVSGTNPSVRTGDYTTLPTGEISGSPTSNPVIINGTFTRNGLSVYVNRADGGGSTQYFTNNYIQKVVIKGTGTLPSELSAAGGAEC